MLSPVTSFALSSPGSARHGGSSDRRAPSPRQAPWRGRGAPGTTAREEAPPPASTTAAPATRPPARSGRAASPRPAFPGPPPPAARALSRGAGPAPPDRRAGERRGRQQVAPPRRRRRSRGPALGFLLPEFTANGAAILERGRRDRGAATRGRPGSIPGCPRRRLPRSGAASRRHLPPRRTGRASHGSPPPFRLWGSPAGESEQTAASAPAVPQGQGRWVPRALPGGLTGVVVAEGRGAAAGACSAFSGSSRRLTVRRAGRRRVHAFARWLRERESTGVLRSRGRSPVVNNTSLLCASVSLFPLPLPWRAERSLDFRALPCKQNA